MEVLRGPSSADYSRQCAYRQSRTEAKSAANNCSVLVPRSANVGFVTHLLRIPDTAVGHDHQMRAWVDADRDGELDSGEPYVTFESDFSSRTLTESGFYSYDYPRDFIVRFAAGGQKLGRGGHDSELRLVLLEPIRSTVASHIGLPVVETVYEPAAGVPVGAPTLVSGPSGGQQVECVNAGRSAPRPPTDQSACVTDEFGEIVVRYRVPIDAIDLFAMQQDLLRINIDDNSNGRLDVTADRAAAEPVAYLQVPIAKAVNYVALGDSYSSGENGDAPETGAYQAG